MCVLALAAGGVAHHPAHRVAGRDGDQLLARLERDVGDLGRCGVELVEGALGVGVDLDGVDVAVLGRLDARHRRSPRLDALLGLLVVLRSFSFFSGTGFSCPGSGSGFGTSTILTGGFGSGSRLAALNAGLSRIGISGTRTVVAQAATVSGHRDREPEVRGGCSFAVSRCRGDVLRPVEGVHVDAEGVLAHRLHGPGRREDEGEEARQAPGVLERAALEASAPASAPGTRTRRRARRSPPRRRRSRGRPWRRDRCSRAYSLRVTAALSVTKS